MVCDQCFNTVEALKKASLFKVREWEFSRHFRSFLRTSFPIYRLLLAKHRQCIIVFWATPLFDIDDVALKWLKHIKLLNCIDYVHPRKELRPTHALHVLISEPDSHLFSAPGYGSCAGAHWWRHELCSGQCGAADQVPKHGANTFFWRLGELRVSSWGDKSLSISTRELSGNVWEKRRELYPAKLLDCHLTSESKEFKARTIW